MLLLIAWASGIGLILALDDPRLRFPYFLFGWALASSAWWALVARARRALLSARVTNAAIALAIFFRLVALWSAPAFSEDVFRYVYEGRVVWREGPAFPFAVAPAEAPSHGVDPALLDPAWLRLNHAHLSTIYPPLAQLVFAFAAGLGELLGGGHLYFLKLLLVMADLGVWLLLSKALPRLGQSGSALAWGLSPLVILETAREGHGDALSAFGLTLMIAGLAAARPARAYIGLVLAALTKLNGLIALPALLRSERRGRGVLIALPLLALPWLLAGKHAGAGLFAYAESWRAGDGLFGLALSLAELTLGGTWVSFGAWTITAQQLARLITLATFAGLMLPLLLRRAEPTRIPERAAACLLGFLLVTPTLHPWYVLWVLPFAALPGFVLAPTIMLLASLVALLHHPSWLELSSGEWTDLPWVRALVHVPVWCLALFHLVRRGANLVDGAPREREVSRAQ